MMVPYVLLGFLAGLAINGAVHHHRRDSGSRPALRRDPRRRHEPTARLRSELRKVSQPCRFTAQDFYDH